MARRFERPNAVDVSEEDGADKQTCCFSAPQCWYHTTTHIQLAKLPDF